MTTAIRIGDAEREAAISSLTSHFAEGRLTQVEHDERTTLALHAKTGRDLDVLFADLPRRGEATPATRRPARGFRIERLVQPLFAALFIGVMIFVILNLLPTIALVILAVVACRLLFGFRRHHWYRSQRWYGPPRRW
ncbi:MAG TPA: DUF1707 domain-containing protein [Acidothermaceae bacterium]